MCVCAMMGTVNVYTVYVIPPTGCLPKIYSASRPMNARICFIPLNSIKTFKDRGMDRGFNTIFCQGSKEVGSLSGFSREGCLSDHLNQVFFGAEKHLQHAGQGPLRTRTENHCLKFRKCDKLSSHHL